MGRPLTAAGSIRARAFKLREGLIEKGIDEDGEEDYVHLSEIVKFAQEWRPERYPAGLAGNKQQVIRMLKVLEDEHRIDPVYFPYSTKKIGYRVIVPRPFTGTAISISPRNRRP